MDPGLLIAAASEAGVAKMSEVIGLRRHRRVYFTIQIGGSFAILAVMAILVCAILVGVGMTFVTGTEVLEAAVYTVAFSGVIAGTYVLVGRSRTAPVRPAITTEERLAAARAAALLASEGEQQRLEGALQLEALAHVRPDLLAPAAQALTGLVSGSSGESRPSPRHVALAAVQALSRLNSYLRDQGLTVDLRLAGLAGLDLSGLDLRGADLTRANLTESTLAGTDLTGANLAGARLDGADLSQADLAYAYMQEASLDHVLLAGTHLEGTYLPSTGKALL
jgi:hypothetical protein